MTDSRTHLGFRLFFRAWVPMCGRFRFVSSHSASRIRIRPGWKRCQTRFCKSEFHFNFDWLSVQVLSAQLTFASGGFICSQNELGWFRSFKLGLHLEKIILVLKKNIRAVQEIGLLTCFADLTAWPTRRRSSWDWNLLSVFWCRLWFLFIFFTGRRRDLCGWFLLPAVCLVAWVLRLPEAWWSPVPILADLILMDRARCFLFVGFWVSWPACCLIFSFYVFWLGAWSFDLLSACACSLWHRSRVQRHPL